MKSSNAVALVELSELRRKGPLLYTRTASGGVDQRWLDQ